MGRSAISQELKELLIYYGELYVVMRKLEAGRSGSSQTLAEYDAGLGPTLPHEPVMVVTVSSSPEPRLLKGDSVEVSVSSEEHKLENVVQLDLPEDEFWFFSAFRPGLFNVDKELPGFIYEMAFVHAFAKFEAYLSHSLLARYKRHPNLMGSQKELKYEQVFVSKSKEELIDYMSSLAVTELMYKPISYVLEFMKEKLGFKGLKNSLFREVELLALKRNCIMHTGSRVSPKLATFAEEFVVGERLPVSSTHLYNAIETLKKLAYSVEA